MGRSVRRVRLAARLGPPTGRCKDPTTGRSGRDNRHFLRFVETPQNSNARTEAGSIGSSTGGGSRRSARDLSEPSEGRQLPDRRPRCNSGCTYHVDPANLHPWEFGPTSTAGLHPALEYGNVLTMGDAHHPGRPERPYSLRLPSAR